DLAVIPERQLAAFQRVPLFHALSLAALEELARSATEVTFADGEILMREGDVGDRYLVVAEGEAEGTQSGRVVAVGGPCVGVRGGRDGGIGSVRVGGFVRAYALNADEFIGAVSGHRVASARAAAIIDDRLAVGAD